VFICEDHYVVVVVVVVVVGVGVVDIVLGDVVTNVLCGVPAVVGWYVFAL